MSKISTDRLDRMPWRDLARLTTDARVPAHQRRQAEKRLALRLPALTLGEQVAVARIAPRGVLADLAGLHRAEVLDALLGNPRTTAEDLLEILQGGRCVQFIHTFTRRNDWKGDTYLGDLLVPIVPGTKKGAWDTISRTSRVSVRIIGQRGASPFPAHPIRVGR